MKLTFPRILIGAAMCGTVMCGVMWLSGCAAGAGGGASHGSAELAGVTKEHPFVNSLGMKFVPVPGTKILMCTTETTVAQYQAAGMGYQAPKFAQGPDHCAVNISQKDAKAWCAWLSKKDGRKYRLPSDAEWSAAVGPTMYPWGNQWPPPNNFGNYAGQEMRGCTEAERAILFKGFNLIAGFSDRHKFTAPVGSYPANGLGIYDLGGNAWEWCGDKAVVHGGSWFSDGGGRDIYASSFPFADLPGSRRPGFGFRCVVER